MKIGVTWRIGLVLVIVAAVGAGGMTVVLRGLGEISRHFSQASQVEAPAVQAAHEMELNNNGIGLSVLSYILHRDPQLGATISRDLEDFGRGLAQLQRSSGDQKERRNVQDIARWFLSYRQAAWELVAVADSIGEERRRLNDLIQSMDEALEVHGSPLHGKVLQTDATMRELALAAEAENAEISAWAMDYHHDPGPVSRQRIERRADELEALVRQLTRSGAGDGQERMRLQRATKQMRASIDAFIGMEDERIPLQRVFLSLRDNIDTALDQSVQPALAQRMLAPYRAAEQESKYVWRTALLLVPAYIGLIALAVFVLMQTIAKPLNRLRRATVLLAEGALDVQVPAGGSDEIGELARDFNAMVKRLKLTTVSRDRLEASEAILRTTVAQLQDEIAQRHLLERNSVEMEQVARRSEKLAAVGTLIAGVAHEVRNPLFGLSSTLDAMRVRFRDDARLEKYLDVLSGELIRLNRLMSDLLDYGRPVEAVKSLASFAEVVQEALVSCRSLADQSGVQLVALLDVDLPRVTVNADRMAQALINVVENALQHSPRGAVVTVEVGRARSGSHRDEIECKVRDSGQGFTVDEIDKVFQPFYSRRRGGTGLGLAIVSRIMEEHGGTVEASNPEGGGALLVLRIPFDSTVPGPSQGLPVSALESRH